MLAAARRLGLPAAVTAGACHGPSGRLGPAPAAPAPSITTRRCPRWSSRPRLTPPFPRPARCLAPPRRRSRAPLPRLPRGARRRRRDRRAVPRTGSRSAGSCRRASPTPTTPSSSSAPWPTRAPSGATAPSRPVTRDRLEHELGHHRRSRTSPTTSWWCTTSCSHGPTHCGRGSVANSMVSYCLGITHVEPLGAGPPLRALPQSRARKDPPDIDLDFPWDERDQILAYVFRTLSPAPRGDGGQPQLPSACAARCARWPRCTAAPPARSARSPAAFPGTATRSRSTSLLATHPNFQGLDLPAGWQDLARAGRSRWSACRGISRCIRAAWSSCPRALTDYVPARAAR